MTTEISADYIRAAELNRRIITAAQLAQQSLYEMCIGFKEMRDSKLYKELGYTDFGDYCEQETGFKRSQAYSYITIAEKLPADFVQSTGQIGVQKLYLLAKMTEEERAQITAETDLESTTVKELREQIEQLKQSEAKTKSQLEHVNTVYEDMYKSFVRNRKLYEEQLDKNANLEKQLKKLENRPVEVATQIVEKIPDDYISREAYEKLVDSTNAERKQRDAEYLTLTRKLYKAETALEEELNKPREKVIDKTAVYNALMDTAADALDRLLEFVEQNETEFGECYDTFIESHRRDEDD